MATAYAPNSPVETVGAKSRMSISLPTNGPTDNNAYSSPQPSPRLNLPPPPNPPFVFPARNAPSSAPSSFSRATGQRPRSAIESQERSLDFGGDAGGLRSRRSPALPDFSFNPGASLSPDYQPRTPPLPEFSFNPRATTEPDTSMLSPPLSPSSPRTAPNRGAHRRYGSEFVGGKIKSGQSITVMSTSPTRSENGVASPTLTPVDASMQRRGRHAHRRSAAISSHDLTMILKPTSPNPRGSSAPASPADFDKKMRPFSDVCNEPPRPNEPDPEPEAEKMESQEPAPLEPSRESSPKPVPRARVGFSDTLEFIPRPLSLVSTDTSSTIRGPGHSVSGSISSIISLSNSTIADRDAPETIGSPISTKKNGSRPSTAGAVLERTPSLLAAVDDASPTPRRRNSIPLLTGLPTGEPTSPALPSPTKTPKRWSFFGFDSLTSSSSPTNPRRHSSSSADTATRTSNQTNSSSEDVSDVGENEAEPQSDKKSAGKKKKQKKVKSWAGSILTRKPKSRSQKKATRRSMTPPLPKEDGDDDMKEDYAETTEPLVTPAVTITESPMSTQASSKPEDEAQYPMIDLDAALGPFNTPSTRDPAWEEAQRAGAPPKRQLHSAAGLRGFQGPGMHYHRRAESAPEMPPFEAVRFGIPRFGSSSTMADVFEEDEEDEDDTDIDPKTPSPKTTSEESTPEASGASAVDGDAESMTDEMVSTPTQEIEMGVGARESQESCSMNTSVNRKGSGASLDVPSISANSIHDVILEEPVRSAADQERISIYETIADSSDSAPSPRRIITSKDLAPVEIHPLSLGAPSLSPYSMSHSSFPSPRSPMSYDAHRVSTAPSSVTEENHFQSLLMGEPGPEVVRISVDLPSLASSNSTMTRDSNFPGVRPRNTPFHDQRPASFTSTSFGRRRSSLASLSRLISSAHGERSKLSIEVPLDGEADKKQKLSKSKRLSRLMQFWKTKESTDS